MTVLLSFCCLNAIATFNTLIAYFPGVGQPCTLRTTPSVASALTFAYACVAAGEAVPFLTVSVQPDAEDHEDDPAGSSDARYKGWLLDHVRDLLGEGVLRAHGLGHSPRCI